MIYKIAIVGYVNSLLELPSRFGPYALWKLRHKSIQENVRLPYLRNNTNPDLDN